MQTPPKSKRTFARTLNVGLLRLSRRWLAVFSTIVGLYVAGVFAAPILMHFGATGPAQVLYSLYSPFCHQMVFRSAFLFGDQAFYPREVSGSEYTPFEVYAQNLPEFQSIDVYATDDPQQFARLILAARAYPGNEAMGYKTTICARDTSIYLFLFIGTLIYAIPQVRRRLRPVPIWLYLLLGIGPIGIDGVSQLLSYPIFSLWPVRETLPEFRVITGALFGLMNAWLALPYLEASFQETRETLEQKLWAAGIRV